jgi:hypothetical protein
MLKVKALRAVKTLRVRVKAIRAVKVLHPFPRAKRLYPDAKRFKAQAVQLVNKCRNAPILNFEL